MTSAGSLLLAAATVLLALTASATGLESGVRTLSPVAQSSVYPIRSAVVVAIGRADDPASGQAEASAYARRLQELGFSVTTIGPSRRFDADAAFRDLATKLPPGSDVALVVAGATRAKDGDLFMAPEDMPPEAATSSSLQAEALSLALLLRSVQKARPTKLVGVVDDCRSDSEAGPCPLEAAAGATGANLIALSRGANGAPDRRGVGDTLSVLMAQEGLTFAALFDRLDDSFRPRGATLSRTPGLTTAFAFTPQRYFESIDDDCNRNVAGELAADVAQKRLRACDAARRNWPYADHFGRSQEFAQQQAAFAATVGRCSPTVVAAIERYKKTYPSGAFFDEADRRAEACREPPPPPPVNPATLFRTEDGYDFPENDIDIAYDVTLDVCRARCAGNARCVAFTFNASKNRCFLKDRVVRVRNFREAVSGVRRGTSDADDVERLKGLPAYNPIEKVYDNIDFENYGDKQADYVTDWNSTLDECKATCEHDRRCRAFTFNSSKRACILKTSVKNWSRFPGAYSGKKY